VRVAERLIARVIRSEVAAEVGARAEVVSGLVDTRARVEVKLASEVLVDVEPDKNELDDDSICAALVKRSKPA
jgi:hypothetical protein